MKLIYDKPSSGLTCEPRLKSWVNDAEDRFQQTVLPLGCGDLGAGVFGETAKEQIVINEKTLWRGGKTSLQNADNYGNIYGKDEFGKTKSDYFYKIRELVRQKKYKKAEKVFTKHFTGDLSVMGGYLCWGDVFLDFGHENVTDYKRELDLETAILTVSYTADGVKYKREYFTSHPAGVLAVALYAENEPFEINTASFVARPELNATHTEKDGKTTHEGTLPNGLKYYAAMVVQEFPPACRGEGREAEGGPQAVIYLAAGTDYECKFPDYRSGESAEDVKRKVEERIANAVKSGYQKIKEEHIADYQRLYGRLTLDLGAKTPETTTDALLQKYQNDTATPDERKHLEQLLFQFGRYLLISSSRQADKLPANLQGVWNTSPTPPWNADYHINVNLQMNYWPAYNTNLAECVAPLVRYMEGLRKPGQLTAKACSGTAAEAAAGLKDEDYGFVAHTQCNPFGYTGIGAGGWQKAQWSPSAVAWLIANIFDGYLFGQDVKYLQEIYPMIKEAARYFDRTLTKTEGGRLASSPAFSPEHGPLTEGNAYEQSLIWQLYKIAIFSAETLKTDEELQKKWREIFKNLNPIEIGKDGQIKEWYEETKIGSFKWYPEGAKHIVKSYDKKHRHLSHLLGLYPGDLIDKRETPEAMAAAIQSLNIRGDISTGWAIAHRINLWARVGDGDRVYKLINNLIVYGMYQNLWDAHPPFQIDGNFGYTAGVAEMLVQSKLGDIELLPALPSAWAGRGKIAGFPVKGGLIISNLEWKDGQITALEIKRVSGKKTTVDVLFPNGEKKNLTV